MNLTKPHIPILIGDCLSVMQYLDGDFFDLIATDPPFNTGKDWGAYNDEWEWNDRRLEEYLRRPHCKPVISAIDQAHSPAMSAYCMFLWARLEQMKRILKPSGSIYVHCDQTANSYIRMVMDAIFGQSNMMNDIIWKRADAKNTASKQFSRDTDNILFYAKDARKSYFNVIRRKGGNVGVDNGKLKVRTDSSGRKFFHHSLRAPTSRPNGMYEFRGIAPPPTGWCMTPDKMDDMYNRGGMELNDKGTEWKRKRYLDEMAGPLVGNMWDDIKRLGPRDAERLGYPTQKPIALYERIIKASCPDGGIVLDPFAGSGTTLVAAHRLERRAIGIDVNHDARKILIRRLNESKSK